MHDIDSTRLETSLGETAYEHELSGEADSFEMPLTEMEEEALAAELLGVSNEAEMDQFLGGLVRKIKNRLGSAARFLAQNGGPLTGALKDLAAKALPSVGGVLGTAIPIPGAGTALGSALGRAASNLLQSELDSFEVEEQEFEMARRYVRLASQAVRHAARIPPRANPSAAPHFALRNAFLRFRGANGFRRRPVYARYHSCPPCPPPEPCPACPTCAQALPTADASPPGAQGITNATGGDTSSDTPKTADEMEFADMGESESTADYEYISGVESEEEGEGESESYETDNELLAASSGGRRGGRWVRRGRRIILYL